MLNLQPGATLQGGKYRIQNALGQGGFGITYMGEHTLLERRVAIKEFFIKELCERDTSSSRVTMGTEGSREMVSRYREKFMKEARSIARLNHPHIVRITDVFEENGTAYYVMDYCSGGSLAHLLKTQGRLSLPVATRYIRQVGSALDYIHRLRMNHLDVKPANIMLNDCDEAVLIDFGLAKQYDAGGHQTSSTPVGISEGYAPLEQYKQDGVGDFSPQTDVYALGATYYALLMGCTPPSASDVHEDGLPTDQLQACGIDQQVIGLIVKAMQPRRRDRFESVHEFMEQLPNVEAEADSDENEPTITKREDGASDGDTTIRKPQGRETEPHKAQAKSGKGQAKPHLAPDPPRVFLSRWRLYAGVALIVVLLGVGYAAWHYVTSADDSPAPEEDRIEVKTFTANGVKFEMVKVDGGTFTMGATSEQEADAKDDEKPAHQVTLSSYYIGRTEVTQELWKAVMGSNPSYYNDSTFYSDKGYLRPVEQVSWNASQTFISKLNEQTGLNFRLPTEAEWEFAARGGNRSQGYKYCGGDFLKDVGWCGSMGPQVVQLKYPNELTIYDMSGNVWEWCSDWYGPYSGDAQTNPTGPESGTRRVIRGGCYESEMGNCRSTSRSFFTPNHHYNYLGLRLCLSE